jgi:hypothetical protein
MKVDALLQYCEAYTQKLANDECVPVLKGSSGPIDMDMIAAIVATIRDLQKQIDELKHTPGRAE